MVSGKSQKEKIVLHKNPESILGVLVY
jgi:hypothetical protein